MKDDLKTELFKMIDKMNELLKRGEIQKARDVLVVMAFTISQEDK